MEIKIEELSEKRLDEVIELIHTVFDTKPEDEDYPDKWLPASLEPEKKESKDLFSLFKLINLKYYVAIEKKFDDVAGTVGFYTLEEDANEAYWLAWFFVVPKYKKKGIGEKLLNFIIRKAKKDGKKFVRLYTSDNPKEKEAQIFYEHKGFKITNIESTPNKKEIKIYRELRL